MTRSPLSRGWPTGGSWRRRPTTSPRGRRRRLQHTWSLGVEEQYYIVWPVLLIAVTLLLAARARRYFGKITVGHVRLAAFVIATLGAMASATAAIVLTTDTTRDRIYFGTDTRAQALLVGAAASALLVRDWSALNRGWCLIRTRWGRRVARVLPMVGLAVLAALTHYATRQRGVSSGTCLLIVVAVAAVLVGCPGGSRAARNGGARPGLAAAGVGGRDFLWCLPLALADLFGAQRRTHRDGRGSACSPPAAPSPWRWRESRTGRSNNPSGGGGHNECPCCRWPRPPSPAPPRRQFW